MVSVSISYTRSTGARISISMWSSFVQSFLNELDTPAVLEEILLTAVVINPGGGASLFRRPSPLLAVVARGSQYRMTTFSFSAIEVGRARQHHLDHERVRPKFVPARSPGTIKSGWAMYLSSNRLE